MSSKPNHIVRRQYLINPRFQLKYTGYVVIVTVIVASVLGAFAYHYSRGQSEMLALATASMDIDSPGLGKLSSYADAEDKQVLWGIIFGVLFMVLTLGATGIFITHKLAGPSYKLKMLMDQVGADALKLKGRLRRGDELQDLMVALEEMVGRLRQGSEEDLVILKKAIQNLDTNQPEIALLKQVTDRLERRLES